MPTDYEYIDDRMRKVWDELKAILDRMDDLQGQIAVVDAKAERMTRALDRYCPFSAHQPPVLSSDGKP